MKTLFLCLVLASPAWAQVTASPDNTERARDAFGAAQKLYQASRFTEALKKFEEAQALKPHPVIVFNIARCHELLGALPQALRAYREYLRLSPQAADKDAVVASITSLEKRLPPPTTQQLLVNAEPALSMVFLDGKRIGPAPLSLELPLGEHSLEVRAEGYETLKRTVALTALRAIELNVALRATAVATDAPRREPVLTPAPAPAPPIVTQPLAATRRRTFTWVAGGAALASVAVASGLGVGANGTVAQLRTGDGSRSGAEAGALASQAKALATGSNIAWGLAGAAAITAVVLFFVEGSGATSNPATTSAPSEWKD